MSESIIEAIDNSIRDFGMSEDAMRWTPEPVIPGFIDHHPYARNCLCNDCWRPLHLEPVSVELQLTQEQYDYLYSVIFPTVE